MNIIFTLLALFPSLLQAGAQGGSAASVNQFEIQQKSIEIESHFKMINNTEFTNEIVGLV